jgi:hypothetical protein
VDIDKQRSEVRQCGKKIDIIIVVYATSINKNNLDAKENNSAKSQKQELL